MEAAAPFALASVTMAAAAAKKVEAGFRRLPLFKTFNRKCMATEIAKKPFLKIALDEAERQTAVTMLQEHNLPAADLDDDKLLYILFDGDKAVGTAGLEVFDNCALLRSVSVLNEAQGKGYGRIINEEIEKSVKESGIGWLYLLTTTAKDFFDRQGYSIIKREEAPDAIRQTTEFSSLCPASAVLMKKRI